MFLQRQYYSKRLNEKQTNRIFFFTFIIGFLSSFPAFVFFPHKRSRLDSSNSSNPSQITVSINSPSANHPYKEHFLLSQNRLCQLLLPTAVPFFSCVFGIHLKYLQSYTSLRIKLATVHVKLQAMPSWPVA